VTARRLFLASAAAALALAPAGVSSAKMNQGTLNCHGRAVVTGTDDGKAVTVTVDSADEKVTLPRTGDARYVGEVSPTTHDHFGAVSVNAGPFKVAVGKWGVSKNVSNLPSSTGVKHYSFPSWVPPFKLKLSGYHTSGNPTGTCSGFIELSLMGSALSSPVGLGSVAATVAFLGGIVVAGIPKGPKP
jgi:hypothetical protein